VNTLFPAEVKNSNLSTGTGQRKESPRIPGLALWGLESPGGGGVACGALWLAWITMGAARRECFG